MSESIFGELDENNNPKVKPGRKYDSGKLQWSLLLQGCRLGLLGAVRVLMFGAKKYAPNEWQGVAVERYIEAQYRHLDAIAEHGLLAVDPESGELHVHHVTTNAIFIGHFAEKASAARVGPGPGVLPDVPADKRDPVPPPADSGYPFPVGVVPRREG